MCAQVQMVLRSTPCTTRGRSFPPAELDSAVRAAISWAVTSEMCANEVIDGRNPAGECGTEIGASVAGNLRGEEETQLVCAPLMHGDRFVGREFGSTVYIWSILALEAAYQISLEPVHFIFHRGGARMVSGGGMATVFSLALTYDTSNLRNHSASSMSQNNLSCLESRSSRNSSPPSTVCSNEERSSIAQTPDRPDDPFLVGSPRVLKRHIPTVCGEDLTLYLRTF